MRQPTNQQNMVLKSRSLMILKSGGNGKEKRKFSYGMTKSDLHDFPAALLRRRKGRGKRRKRSSSNLDFPRIRNPSPKDSNRSGSCCCCCCYCKNDPTTLCRLPPWSLDGSPYWSVSIRRGSCHHHKSSLRAPDPALSGHLACLVASRSAYILRFVERSFIHPSVHASMEFDLVVVVVGS